MNVCMHCGLFAAVFEPRGRVTFFDEARRNARLRGNHQRRGIDGLHVILLYIYGAYISRHIHNKATKTLAYEGRPCELI